MSDEMWPDEWPLGAITRIEEAEERAEKAERELAEANVCERENFRRAEHNLARAEAAEREVAELRERPFVTAAPKDDELVLTIPGFGSALFRACGDIGRELVDRLRSEHSAQGGTPNERSSEGTNRGGV